MKKTLLITCLLASLAPAAFSDALEWASPVDGKLDDASFWNPNAEPALGDSLYFKESGDYKVESTKDVSVANVTANGSSGVLQFDLGSYHLESGLAVFNQNVNWSSGRLSTILQIGNGTSDLTGTFAGSSSHFSGAAASVGRSSSAAAGSNNTFTVSGGATFNATSDVIVGANDTNTAFAANGNKLIFSGSGTTATIGGGINVGNLGSGTNGASASGNSLIIEKGASVIAANLNIGRRGAGTLYTATNNTVSVTGTAPGVGTGSTLLTVNGNIGIGAAGGGNKFYIGEYGKVIANGNTTVNSRAGNMLEVDGGIYDATGGTGKITAYNLATISINNGGNIIAKTLNLENGSLFLSKGQSTASFESLIMGSSGTFEFTIGSGESHSLVSISGASLLNGTLRITFADSFAPTAGQSLQLFNFGEVNGEFAQIVLPNLSINLQWDTSQLYESGVISVIPEPASASLLTGGLLVALASYRVVRGFSGLAIGLTSGK